MKRNKHGLSRNIPHEIKRRVRQECGFGCVICGNAIYNYEHILPEWIDAKEHEVEKIALLCSNCHTEVTKGLLPKEEIQKKENNPYCLEIENSNYQLFISDDEPLKVVLGKIAFENINSIIEIDDKAIFSVDNSKEEKCPPIINALFYNRDGVEVASIVENEWIGRNGTFDIEAIGNRFLVRSMKYNIDLQFSIDHPNTINITKLNLRYNHKSISGDFKNGFQIETDKTTLSIGEEVGSYKNSKFGISIKGSRVFLGSGQTVKFYDSSDNESFLEGHYEADGGELTIEEREGDSPKLHFKSEGEGGGFGIHFKLPVNPEPIPIKFEKQERNAKCKCSSGKKFKDCCFLYNREFESEFNKPELRGTIDKIRIVLNTPTINFKFKYDESIKRPVQIDLYLSNPVLKLNTFHNVNIHHLASSLNYWILMIEGFIVKHYNHYNGDVRDRTVIDLNDLLLGIVALDRMKRDGFDTKNFHKSEIDHIEKDLNNIGMHPAGKLTGNDLLGSVKLLKCLYNTDSISNTNKDRILAKFQQIIPTGTDIGLVLLDIIKKHDIYKVDGFNDAYKECLNFLSHYSKGAISKYCSPSP